MYAATAACKGKYACVSSCSMLHAGTAGPGPYPRKSREAKSQLSTWQQEASCKRYGSLPRLAYSNVLGFHG